MDEVHQVGADQRLGRTAEHPLPRGVGRDDRAVGADDGQQVPADLEEDLDLLGRAVLHSNKPARIAEATAAARSDTPSFS